MINFNWLARYEVAIVTPIRRDGVLSKSFRFTRKADVLWARALLRQSKIDAVLLVRDRWKGRNINV